MKDLNAPIIYRTNCHDCHQKTICILAPLNYGDDYQPLCLNCLDVDGHESQINDLMQYFQEEKTDNEINDVDFY